MWKIQWIDKWGLPWLLRGFYLCGITVSLWNWGCEKLWVCMENIASFLLTSPSSPPMYAATYAHTYILSQQKLDRNPVNMQMLKSLNMEWLEKTKGCQIALENNVPLLCIFRSFLRSLERVCVCVCACVVAVRGAGKSCLFAFKTQSSWKAVWGQEREALHRNIQ